MASDLKVWTADPGRKDVPLERRWGMLTGANASPWQFNVYRAADGYLLTIQSQDGEESESGKGIFHGGMFESIALAYESVISYLSDLAIGSGLISDTAIASGIVDMPAHDTMVVDTTPGLTPYICLSTIGFAGGMMALEIRHFDPTTRQKLEDETGQGSATAAA